MKETLIDFLGYCYKKGLIDNDLATVLDYETEVYIKSINEAQNESLNVSDNEDKRETCMHAEEECDNHFKDGYDCRSCIYY